MRGLLDTSVLVALEVRGAAPELPDEAALSVISVEELALGVAMARARGDDGVADRRQLTSTAVLATFELHPVTTAVARESEALRARDARQGCSTPRSTR